MAAGPSTGTIISGMSSAAFYKGIIIGFIFGAVLTYLIMANVIKIGMSLKP